MTDILLKDTLNMPKTNFSMKANILEKGPLRINHWDKIGLYSKIQKKNINNKKFILHDGPPFANGNIHIGTAMNKILKNIILMYKSMNGFYTPFIPGWDCHGLPIEHKVIKNSKENLNKLELRLKCKNFANKFIEEQKKDFINLGILADWKSLYKTMDKNYEYEVINLFANMIEKNLIYRSKKPVYWSIICQTTLAEAEIEYNNHIACAIYVSFRIPKTELYNINNLLLNEGYKYNFVIWTTTPWTLPANKAIALNPNEKYRLIYNYIDKEAYFVSSKRVSSFLKKCNLSEKIKLENEYNSDTFINVKYNNHFSNKLLPVILSSYVTNDTGTGCVHIAPGHGVEDYKIGLKFNLDIYSPINDQGYYINDGFIPNDLINVSVFDEKGNGFNNEANIKILNILKNKNVLLQTEKYNHSYPYCWRSKTPLILRAMNQWFIDLEKSNLRKNSLDAIKNIKWVPSWGKNRMKSFLSNRTDWCISRQRSWGVPLIIFFDKKGKAILDSKLIREIGNKIKEKGTDIWFKNSAKELLIGTSYEGYELEKSTDTLDVWIESGISHMILKNKKYFPADLYLEGSDQHRGWFQSSLFMSMINNNVAPYKEVITHGFILNQENLEKVSKSSGDNLKKYMNNFGPEIIRLWVSSENYTRDLPISENILNQVSRIYRIFRNTIKFQLGNIFDFEYNKEKIDVVNMTPIDKWILHKTNLLIESIIEDYNSYQIHKACHKLQYFCSVTLSSIYHDILKDRLYTYGPKWKFRKSSQTAIYYILNSLLSMLSPILSFTTDEAYSFLKENKEFINDSIYLQKFPSKNKNWNNFELYEEIEKILNLKKEINEKIEEYRNKKIIKKSLDCKLIINLSKNHNMYTILQKYKSYLPEFFIVSEVIIKENNITNNIKINIEHASGFKCARSWRWVKKLFLVKDFGKVSMRCKMALKDKYNI